MPLWYWGKDGGVFVLFFDMVKVFAAVRLCQWLFPSFILAGILAGCGAIFGHIFPIYMKLHGGKGIAGFGGFILAADWRLFLFLLAVGCILALVFNYGCSISFSAAVLFPILYGLEMRSAEAFCILAVCSSVIIYRNWENVIKIREGRELPIRSFLYRYVGRGGKGQHGEI